MTCKSPAAILTEADRDWFAENVEAVLPELYGTAVRLCGDRTDAEDLVAETVARAWEGLSSLERRASFRGWLFRILNNTFISHCRSAPARAVHEPFDTVAAEPFSLFERLHHPILLWYGNPELDFLNRLLREDLERAIDDLPDVFRPVVVMVDVEGLAYREVAEILEVPMGTVRSRLARGRGLLQERLWQHALDRGMAAGPDPSE